MSQNSLWQHSDFVKLWTGQTLSSFGSKVRFLVMPLTAILFLDASPLQLGILSALGALPSLLIGLFIGTWVDRWRRRPIMISADVGRALLILSVPLAAITNALWIEHLYLVAFGMGILDLFFSVGYRAFLPGLVGRDNLVAGNSKLELGNSAAEIIGPALGGVLVQMVTAPIALLVDGVSFIASVFFLTWIRQPEEEIAQSKPTTSLLHDIREGLQLVTTNRTLLGLAGCIGTLNLCNSLLEAVSLLYMTHELGIAPASLGLIFGLGSIGFMLGAALCEQFVHWFGLGPVIIVGVLLPGLSDLALPLVRGPQSVVVSVLMVAQVVFGFGLTLYNVTKISLIQIVTPNHMLGRVNAIMLLIGLGFVPFGALLGGVIGETLPLRTTLFVAGGGELLAVLWLLFSPLQSVQVRDRIERAPN